MNVVIPRFFCRVLCPLGAFLGTLAPVALWRIDRDPHKCVDCDLCLKSCEGASDPHTQLRKSECFVCFNCIEDCPTDAISFSIAPPKRHEIAARTRAAGEGGQQRAERYERGVDHGEIGGSAEGVRLEGARVRPLEDDDPRVHA